MKHSVKSLMAIADTTMDSEADHIERVHGKHWDSRADVVRNVVSVGAVVLAGTIAFLDKDPPHGTTILGMSLLASWLLLIASLSCGLYVLWQSVTLRSFFPKFFNARPSIHAQFARLDLSQPDVPDRSAEIVRIIVDGVVNPIGVADNRAQAATKLCMVTFGASMACLLMHALLRSA
jgi:hypothetical protein